MMVSAKMCDLCNGREHVEVYAHLPGIDKGERASVIDQLIQSFEYTSSNISGPTPMKVDPRELEYSGCSCNLQSCLSTCPCITRFGPNYTSDGKLLQSSNTSGNDCPTAGKPIFECNASCLCGDACTNRVVQNGVHHKMEVFRTAHKGWGLRALENIEEDAFVCEYAGEVLTCEEATLRMASMQADDPNYIFAIKETFGNGTSSTTYIDARLKGSIARFINHSCKPNLFPVAVRIHNEIPRIALFAKRKIETGEELAYHYNTEDVAVHSKTVQMENAMDSVCLPQKPCYCDSPQCLKYLPYNAFTQQDIK